MQQIATKAKISLWCVVGDKEKIDFGLCDFSPDQVASLDRIVRAKDEPVRLTIEPEQKKLQIAPIEATVRIVSLACRSGGQKIKIADFKSPDSRAEAIKRMSAAETPLILTLEPIQNQLPFAEDEPRRSEPAGDDGPALAPDSQTHRLKFAGLRKCSAEVTVYRDGDRWAAGHAVFMGEDYEILSETGQFKAATKALALQAVSKAMIDWLLGLTMASKADRARRTKMVDQIADQMRVLIDQAGGEPAGDDGPPLSPDARSYVLKLKGLRKCSASLTVDRWDAGWDIWFCVGMGNYEIETEDGEITAPTRASALEAARARMIDWLESLTMATQADRKRRLAMQQKINAEMGNIIEEAKREDGDGDA